MKIIIRTGMYGYFYMSDEVIYKYAELTNQDINKDSEGYWWYLKKEELPTYIHTGKYLPHIHYEKLEEIKEKSFKFTTIKRHDINLINAFELTGTSLSKDYKIVDVPTDENSYLIINNNNSEAVVDIKNIYQ